MSGTSDRGTGSGWFCHVFDGEGGTYAYDLNTNGLLAIESELADLLRGDGEGTPAAREALRRARDEGLLLPRRPRLVPRTGGSAGDARRGLRHLVLTVTDTCNLRCAYCLHGAGPDWIRRHGRRRMSVATVLAAVDYFLERRDPERRAAVSFYGGEPLENREVIAAAARRVRSAPGGGDALLTVDTNGVLLDEAVLDLVLEHRLRLQISLDGPPEIHDRYRRDAAGHPTCERILANIDRLLERDPAAADRLGFVVTVAPPVDLAAVTAFFARFPPFVRRGISRRPAVTVNLARLFGGRANWPTEEQAGLPPLNEQVDSLREAYFDAVAGERRAALSPVIRGLFEPDLIRFHHRSRAGLAATFSPGGNCDPGRRKLHVTRDGRFQPCERTGDKMFVGRLGEGVADETVAALHEGFHAAAADRCAECWALRLCGVCFAALAAEASGESSAGPIPESVCRRVRGRWEEVMKLMVRILALPPAARAWLDETVVES